MKIKVASSREEIKDLMSNEKIVHLTFRPSNEDICGVVEACPKLEAIQIPRSYFNTVSKSVKRFLDIQKIQLIEGDVWGHRKKLYDHYEVSLTITDKIVEMKLEGNSEKSIVEELCSVFRLSEQQASFIVQKTETV